MTLTIFIGHSSHVNPPQSLLLGNWLMAQDHVSFPIKTLYLILLGSFELHGHYSFPLFTTRQKIIWIETALSYLSTTWCLHTRVLAWIVSIQWKLFIKLNPWFFLVASTFKLIFCGLRSLSDLFLRKDRHGVIGLWVDSPELNLMIHILLTHFNYLLLRIIECSQIQQFSHLREETEVAVWVEMNIRWSLSEEVIQDAHGSLVNTYYMALWKCVIKWHIRLSCVHYGPGHLRSNSVHT